MKILKTLFVAIVLFSYSSNSFAEEKRDCSVIDTSTGVGMYEKWKCQKGFQGLKKKLKEKVSKKKS